MTEQTPTSTTAAPREPRRRRRIRPRTFFALLGPGLIAANAGNDAGGIATYASAGSQFVYRTLFVMLLVTVALVVVQEMSARLGVGSPEGWLWTKITALAPSSSARFMISRG